MNVTATSTIRTADGTALFPGARAFNHYDMKSGTISTAPTTYGWFDFIEDDGHVCLLNGERIITLAAAHAKGYKGTIKNGEVHKISDRKWVAMTSSAYRGGGVHIAPVRDTRRKALADMGAWDIPTQTYKFPLSTITEGK